LIEIVLVVASRHTKYRNWSHAHRILSNFAAGYNLVENHRFEFWYMAANVLSITAAY
jgi:hypothetical protein